MANETEKQRDNSHLAAFQFKKGQSGNPGGRPKGKSLKTYAREMLEEMTDEERQEFFEGIDKRVIWEMAEGKAKQDASITLTKTMGDVLDELQNGQETPA